MRKIYPLPARRSHLLALAVPALLLAVLLLAACRSNATPVAQAPAPTEGPIIVTSEPSPTASLPTETLVPLTPTASATSTETPLPTDTPTPTITPTATETRVPKSIQETENILVMGIDPRPGDRGWRTDTMMVVALDYDANQVGIISIPRDLWVEIPGYGMGRINQADFEGELQKYPGGGPALASKVIEDNLGIKTTHWVRIKQEGLVQMVDALGGVTITLDCPLHEITPRPGVEGAFDKFDLPAGEVFLDGPAAKKFATYRYNSNDFYRGKRQQQLIWAIKERALQVDAIPRIPEMWGALKDTFQTDLSVLDVLRLARLGAALQSDQVHGVVFSTDAIEYAVVGGGAQVLRVADKKQLQKEIDALFAGTPISLQGREGSGICPTPAPTITATPLVIATQAVTVTPTITVTLTPEATATSG